ncbi:pteridine reductase [Bowmanella yangjiangensis]|uniref:Pteridine reductase n=1 Tax=Bowmanella yangjiangensis TaxID=2811230 RepID=A0ABS3CWS0_9ALTE|nr:pteridine reductase [Bowmanella yangjiangensis]MBN7820591.1 pteridine reductase [Bowmanella yangjiangensis]
MMEKVVFISGSAKRLGAAIARALHLRGYNVVLHCFGSYPEAIALYQALNLARPNSAELVQGDLTEITELEGLACNILAKFGRLDAVINNASSFFPTPVSDISLQAWQALIGSNMQAPLFLSHYLADELKRCKGTIINMVDIHALRPLAGYSLYCMAKAGLVSMTESLAIELAPEVRVNAIAPGAILWPEEIEEQQKQQILSQIPLGRLGLEHDITHAVEFLLDAGYITGQILKVDGGRSLT